MLLKFKFSCGWQYVSIWCEEEGRGNYDSGYGWESHVQTNSINWLRKSCYKKTLILRRFSLDGVWVEKK